MKPVHIVLLVLAGALGGAVVTTQIVHKSAPPTQVAAADVQQPAAPAAAPAPAPVPEPAVQPAPEPVKPSPVEAPAPRREAVKPKPAAPPAHARPVETARVNPPPQVQTAPAPAPAPQPDPQPAPVSTPPARPEPEHATPAPPPPPPPAPQVTLNAGVLLPVRLIDGLSSERNQPGDTFTGTLDHELVADGFVIAERGARVEGRVVNVDRGGKVKGVSGISVELTRIHTSDGQVVPVQTDAFERRAEASHQTDAAKVGAGAAVGAIIGAIAGGGKGAAIGAGVGGGAGAGDVLLTRGKPATIPTETRISFRLNKPVTITEKR